MLQLCLRQLPNFLHYPIPGGLWIRQFSDTHPLKKVQSLVITTKSSASRHNAFHKRTLGKMICGWLFLMKFGLRFTSGNINLLCNTILFNVKLFTMFIILRFNWLRFKKRLYLSSSVIIVSKCLAKRIHMFYLCLSLHYYWIEVLNTLSEVI